MIVWLRRWWREYLDRREERLGEAAMLDDFDKRWGRK